jgi:hypothetical protein
MILPNMLTWEIVTVLNFYSTIGTAKQKPRRANPDKQTAAVCASQLRVGGACELCDRGHRQADRFTP